MPSAIRFDLASGRVRYFGSTTHMNVLTKVSASKGPARRQESHWPIALILKDLSPTTHDYLMDLFWEFSNSVIRLVDREAFYRDQESGGLEYYSTFLHLAMLGTGFRYADKSRPDIQRLVLSENVTSTIHEKTKALGRQEIERPGGIPSIQALQLLSGLEFCCGNDDTGWMFSGICFRMVYDAGLHIDHSCLGISPRDTQIRDMVLWASLTADRLWSLYLGRPTTLKLADISPNCLSYVFDPSDPSDPAVRQKPLVTRVYEALLQMMERVGQLCDLRGPRPTRSADSCLQLAAIGQQLRDWYTELPRDLQWSDSPGPDMPLSYFLLHTQYHAALILIHRQFIHINETNVADGLDAHFKSICRATCASSAESIAVILEEYRARFELSQVYGTAVQHAGTAATAMMGEVVLQADPVERARLVRILSSLRITVGLMSKNYRGAGLMVSIIDRFIRSTANRASSSSDREGTATQLFLHPSVPQVQPPVATAGHVDQLVVAHGPAMMANPLHQRWRLDAWSALIPSPAGHLSPTGLPAVPSSFFEGIMEEDLNFGDMSGSFDLSAWGNGPMDGYSCL
ncbi:hypothetical protein NLU13_0957 [Sarocladium strictum]|uniref:Xylanolytic transcriptional activator regulatory domain-containing protein n=1 Tax=Sarocladium strictum TaxID=5046 RepID=A0AA39LBA6_SARSR|nr:hypothetical protein NLU13_0957 [Sarocladium strictum]